MFISVYTIKMKMFKRTIVPVALIILLLLFVGVCACKQHFPIGQSNNVEYTVYGTMRCPYTVKMVKELKEKGKEFQYVDVATPEGNAAYDKVTGGVATGVPYTVHIPTGEHIKGFKKI